MTVNYVKLVIPRKRTADVQPVVERLGHKEVPEMNKMLLDILFRIYREGRVKADGIAGKTEIQKAAG